jgi:soluble lytic murein transglycosylase-like protein
MRPSWKRRLAALLTVASAVAGCDAPTINLPDIGGPSAVPKMTVKGGVQQLPPKALVAIVKREALRNRLEPEFVFGVIAQESAFNAKAVSPAGALGLMQLMPATVDDLNQMGVGIRNPFDPAQNVAGGCRYLRQLYDMLGDTHPRYRWAFTLAAYNGGIGRVKRAITKIGPQASFGAVAPLLPKETQGYVPAVLRHQSRYTTLIKAPAAKSGTKA